MGQRPRMKKLVSFSSIVFTQIIDHFPVFMVKMKGYLWLSTAELRVKGIMTPNVCFVVDHNQ